MVLEAVVAGSSFFSETCEGAFKCGSETAGQNFIIQTRGRNSILQWRQWKTLACASKTHSPTLPLISLVGNDLHVLLSLVWRAQIPEHFHSCCIPLFLLSHLFLCHHWYHAELTAAITTVILLWELYSSSKVKKFQRQMFSLAEANKPIALFPCF